MQLALPARGVCSHALAAVLVMAASAAAAAAADWPQFRGPGGRARSDEKGVPVTWGRDQNIAWRVKLPAPGNSSPIVSNGRVFITGAEDEGRTRTLASFSADDGSLVWSKSVRYEERERTHDTNPHGAATPAADGERVVAWHGTAGLYCYDFDGHELWQADLGRAGHMWGIGSSPIIHDGRVFLNFGPGDRSFVVALDLESGTVLWRVEEPGGDDDKYIGSWSTPVIADIDGRTQVVCSMPARVVGYEPASGEILWTLGGLSGPGGDLMYTSLLISGDRAVVMAGFRGPAAAFKLGGTGDVTETNLLWKTEGPQPQRIGSGAIVGRHVYMANADVGTAQCFDLETGDVLWEERLGRGGAFWATTVFAGGNLYATNQQGTTIVFRPDPQKLDIVASNEMDERTNATPAFANRRVYLRTFEALYCIAE
ncbi:MAG TPA: PQQ-binding-like beta-propeller repeat protein [Planctomycetaceae bacterium]|nr:PQQ-binding-like beta-propeller repeat protein [Planctomycetaceae bacterium]